MRQALVALSSVHLGGYAGGSGGADNGEPLQQYGKALTALQRRLGAGKQETDGQGRERTAMICCVLFYCFESALGESEGAMRHLENGLKILESIRERQYVCRDGEGVKGVGMEAREDDIAEMLARLDLQATMFDDNRAPSLALVSVSEREAGISELGIGPSAAGEDSAEAFCSLEAAYRALNRLQNWLFRFLGENVGFKGLLWEQIPSHVRAEKAQLVRDYARWGMMFEAFRGKSGEMSNGEKILGVQHRVTQLLLESTLPDDTSTFGFDSSAWSLLKGIEDVLRSSGDGDEQSGLQCRSFSSETGVVAPLFLLAVKCSDGHVADKAAALLAACGRREGLYDAQVMAGVLQKMCAVREEKVRDLERSILGGKLEGGLEEEPGKEPEGRLRVPLEIWASDLVDSRIGGFGAIGDGLTI